MKKFASLCAAALLVGTLALSGCHGRREQAAFAVPESFDTSRQYEVVFWAKNDTNKTQTDIYKQAIEDFQQLYPNITVTILKLIECWNSYVWPRLVTDDQAYFLVSNGIQQIREEGFGRENIPAMMAAVVVISVPLVALFLAFRSKIMEGASRGGIKG